VVRCGLLSVDPWVPTMDSQSVASQLFAVSLFPYLGLRSPKARQRRSKTAPGLTLFGFYFLLVFVSATSTATSLVPISVSAPVFASVHPDLELRLALGHEPR
jgi:di/tricarboxylate transporter